MKSFVGVVVLIAVLVTVFQVEESSASSDGLGFQTLMNPKADSCTGACFTPVTTDEQECPCPSGSLRCCRNSDNHCRCCSVIANGPNPPQCCPSTGWAACK